MNMTASEYEKSNKVHVSKIVWRKLRKLVYMEIWNEILEMVATHNNASPEVKNIITIIKILQVCDL